MEHDLELIENYLQGTLDEEERKTVDERIKRDSEFAKRVKLLQEVHLGLGVEVQGFKRDLNEIQLELLQTNKSSFFSTNRSYLIAASIAAFFALFAGYLIWFDNPSVGQLYTAYYQVPPENITVRSESVHSTLSSALKAYNKADYGTALGYFNQALEHQPDHQGIVFYLAICHLSLDENQLALNNFQSIIATKQGEYLTAAQWYLGLTYLKMGDSRNAENVLVTLQNSGRGKYARDAGELLKDLGH